MSCSLLFACSGSPSRKTSLIPFPSAIAFPEKYQEQAQLNWTGNSKYAVKRYSDQKPLTLYFRSLSRSLKPSSGGRCLLIDRHFAHILVITLCAIQNEEFFFSNKMF